MTKKKRVRYTEGAVESIGTGCSKMFEITGGKKEIRRIEDEIDELELLGRRFNASLINDGTTMVVKRIFRTRKPHPKVEVSAVSKPRSILVRSKPRLRGISPYLEQDMAPWESVLVKIDGIPIEKAKERVNQSVHYYQPIDPRGYRTYSIRIDRKENGIRIIRTS